MNQERILDVLKSPHVSEKSTLVAERDNQVVFKVAVDATKLEEQLGWKADENFESGIVKTVAWYLKKYQI